MAAPRKYVNSSELGDEFNTVSTWIIKWLTQAGVKPHRHLVINGRNFMTWNAEEARAAIREHRRKWEETVKEREARKAARAEQAAKANGRKILRKELYEEDEPQRNGLVELPKEEGVNIDAVHSAAPVAPVFDVPQRSEDVSLWEHMSRIEQQMAQMNGLLSQILDLLTAPTHEGTPR